MVRSLTRTATLSQGGPSPCRLLRRAQSSDEIAVRLHGITKRFPGVVANHDINIAVRRGTIHAIVGENGAGKSTLMKILYGMQKPDEGTIEIDGEQVDLSIARPTPSAPASAWCTSTSCSPTT